MHKGDDLPVVSSGTLMAEALVVLTSKSMGGVMVVDKNRLLLGIYTDGDLKRSIQLHKDFLACKIDDLMTSDPIRIQKNRLAVEAFDLMENRPSQISVLPVVDDHNKTEGIIRLHDLVKAGL
jgi:arabinose-5-phosphate isomerase